MLAVKGATMASVWIRADTKSYRDISHLLKTIYEIPVSDLLSHEPVILLQSFVTESSGEKPGYETTVY